MRLKPEIKNKIIKAISSGKSINWISQEYGLAKSTIYHYFKKIKGRRYPKLNLSPSYSEVEGEIIGIFTGDGGLYFWKKNYSYDVSIYFGLKNIGYAKYVQNIFEQYFKKKFKIVRISTLRLSTKRLRKKSRKC